MTVYPDDPEREPDIVLEILNRARQAAPELTDDKLRQIEESVRADFGGIRFRVAKRKKHLSREERLKVFEVAITTNTPNEEITRTSGISRRTLYRLIKRGGQ